MMCGSATWGRLASHERRRVAALRRCRAARLLGVSPKTLDRAVTGQRLRAATVAKIRAAIHAFPCGPRLVVLR